jgi:PhnB protein
MATATKPIPEGYPTVTPYLIVSGASEAIACYKEALGAEEVLRLDGPGGRRSRSAILASCWPTSTPRSGR